MIPVAFILVSLLIFLLWWKARPVKKYSRNLKEVTHGYFGIPGIGLLPYFRGPGCRQKLMEIRQQFGPICKVRMGSYICIWLNDYQLIKEAWSNPAFCGRPLFPGISVRTEGFRGGIIFNDGADFTEQRRFVISTLKSVGLGKALSDQIIQEECCNLVEVLKKYSGRQVSTRHLFNIPAFNIIWKLVTDGEQRFEHDDPEMSKLVETLNRNMELNDGACAAFFMPWLARLFPSFIGWNQYVQDSNFVFNFWKAFAQKSMDLHNSPIYPNLHHQDSLLTKYCNRIQRCTDPNSSFYGDKGILSLATVLQDLFIAGSETTATTLQWICLYLAAFPQCQRKIHQEISANPMHWFQLSNLPYATAFIKEALRFSTLAPLGMVHCCMDNDATLQGYCIPKGTVLEMNACAVHFDPTYWPNPEKFQPERFLTPEGSLKTGEIQGFLSFSLGKRICPGADIAMKTLLTVTVSILKHFTIQSVGDCIDLRAKVGVSAVPYPHKLIFTLRNS